MRKIRKGDKVRVIAGKDKGKNGVVLRVCDSHLIVEGINLVTKHIKSNPNRGVEGGIISKEALIHGSNVALLNEATAKPDRVGFKIIEQDDRKKKARYFKSNDELIDV